MSATSFSRPKDGDQDAPLRAATQALRERLEIRQVTTGSLMTNTMSRLVEDVARPGGHYAHVHEEAISPKHDDAVGEVWLDGRFTYLLYRRPAETP